MAGKNKLSRFLRWPWMIIVYILLAAFLGLLSIPIILLLVWLQRKVNPHGVTEGYCLSRTRKRLSFIFWGLLLLFFGVAVGSVFVMGLGQDKSYWDMQDYTMFWGSVGGAVLLFLLGFYVGFIGVRDTFFPAKSTLAQSIRQQLPYPDEAPPVEQLFAMVDEDLKENGQWFNTVGIGKEWVLGDVANRIDRIRGIFTEDKIRSHHTEHGTNSSRSLKLILIDNRWQKSVTDFNNPKELQAAADYLSLRVPDAARGKNDQYAVFLHMDDIQKEKFEREFRQKQSRRASEQMQRERLSGGPQDMILRQADGSVTSRVTSSLVEERLQSCLKGEETGFALIPARPIIQKENAFQGLHCSALESGSTEKVLLLLEQVPSDGNRNFARCLAADPRQAREILQGWLRRQIPNLAGWELRQMYASSQNTRPQTQKTSKARLALVFSSGASETHTTFTQEDIQIAAEGLIDGTYQIVDLTLPEGYLWIRAEAGNKMDGRCIVEATRPDLDQLRFFSIKASPRQAAAWLTAYALKEFLPGEKGWKDITKQMEKNSKK